MKEELCIYDFFLIFALLIGVGDAFFIKSCSFFRSVYILKYKNSMYKVRLKVFQFAH